MNCVVNPTAKSAGVAGVNAMEDKAFVDVVVVDFVVDVDVDEQDTMTVVKTTIIPIVRQLTKNPICFLFIVIIPFLYIPICLDGATTLLYKLESETNNFIVPHFPPEVIGFM